MLMFFHYYDDKVLIRRPHPRSSSFLEDVYDETLKPRNHGRNPKSLQETPVQNKNNVPDKPIMGDAS
jgi:hypothetical protein